MPRLISCHANDQLRTDPLLGWFLLGRSLEVTHSDWPRKDSFNEPLDVGDDRREFEVIWMVALNGEVWEVEGGMRKERRLKDEKLRAMDNFKNLS